MANHTTGAQRYNTRMDKIFAKSKELNEKYHGKDSFGSGDHRSEAMKKKQEMAKKIGFTSKQQEQHSAHNKRIEEIDKKAGIHWTQRR